MQEITKFKELMERSTTRDQMPEHTRHVDFNPVAEVELLYEFCTILKEKMHLHGCGYVLRNLLVYMVRHNALITFVSAALLFKLFLVRVDEIAWKALRPEVIIVMFEIALFNKQAIKDTKSGPIMSLRMQLYDYCVKYASEIDASVSDPVFKFRLNYCLMFTAFEIKNDMKASVYYFD